MKSERQEAIRALLEKNVIQTQAELAEKLRESGFPVTQATVSRDIREMHLMKVPCEEGGFRYREPEPGWANPDERQIRLLRDCVVSVEAAGQMIVVKTMSGAANTAAETIDSLEMPEIAGSIAGDNTIFLVARDHGSAESAALKIAGLLG